MILTWMSFRSRHPAPPPSLLVVLVGLRSCLPAALSCPAKKASFALELQVAAARAVAALAGLEGCSAAIVECGGAEVLVALLSTPEGHRRPTVALTLTALDALICSGESDSTSGLVVVAGAVDPLRRSAAWCLLVRAISTGLPKPLFLSSK